MYKSRILSDVELDAITLYEHFPQKTVEVISKELKVPSWYIDRILFKYLNGAIDNGKLYSIPIRPPFKVPRKGLNPTPAALAIAITQTYESKLNLKTMNHKDKNANSNSIH